MTKPSHSQSDLERQCHLSGQMSAAQSVEHFGKAAAADLTGDLAWRLAQAAYAADRNTNPEPEIRMTPSMLVAFAAAVPATPHKYPCVPITPGMAKSYAGVLDLVLPQIKDTFNRGQLRSLRDELKAPPIMLVPDARHAAAPAAHPSAAPQGAQPAEPVARIKFGYPGISGTGIRAIYRLPAADKLPEGEYLLHAAPVPQEVREALQEIRDLVWSGKVRYVEHLGGGIWTWPDRAEAALNAGLTIPAKEQQ